MALPIQSSSLDLFARFLDLFDHEAVPHQTPGDLTLEEIEQLHALARGELNEAARRELMPLLSKNQAALEYFAELLKQNSTHPTSNPPPLP